MRREMKWILFLALTWSIAVSNSSMSYPIYGTKRYHRASVTPSVPYYNHYYNQQAQAQAQAQQQLMQSSYPHRSHAQQSTVSQGLPPKANAYESGYVTDNGYYYYPSHEYHTYGMPTYHGDYKPKAVYYAPRPRYSYYEDPEMPPNPLDDLHEEILEEDERERQGDLIPFVADEPAVEEPVTWYEEEPQHMMPTSTNQDDALTNNFVRNLIEYNRRMEERQRLQQLQQQLPSALHVSQQPLDYEEYPEINPDDYEFEPQGAINQFDMQKFRNENSLTTMRSPPQKDTATMDDENVRELKSLAQKHHQEHAQHQSLDGRKNHNEKFFQRKNTNNWKDSSHSAANNAQYEADNDDADFPSMEYDDDSWINWDRKRSGKKSQLPSDTIQATATTTQRPTKKTIKNLGQKEVVLPRPSAPQRHFFGTPGTELIHNKFDYSSENRKGNLSPQSISSNANQLASPTSQTPRRDKTHFQLSTPNTRDKNSKNVRFYTQNGHSEDDDDDADAESNKRSKVKSAPGSIYETIKQLIAMEENVEKNKMNSKSKIHKRFVTSEDSLVSQLNKLKRLAD